MWKYLYIITNEAKSQFSKVISAREGQIIDLPKIYIKEEGIR